MGRRRLVAVLAATTAAAMMSLTAAPAAVADHRGGRGPTVEEFVCFKDTGNGTMLARGKAITTPNGNVRVICTGKQL